MIQSKIWTSHAWRTTNCILPLKPITNWLGHGKIFVLTHVKTIYFFRPAYFLFYKVLTNCFKNFRNSINFFFDLATRFARFKQLLSCWGDINVKKLARSALFAHSSCFSMIGRGKGGKEKGKGLNKHRLRWYMTHK